MDPTISSLILCLESVVSVIAGWIILGQKLSGRKLLGCLFVLIALIITQIPKKMAENIIQNTKNLKTKWVRY